MNQINILQRIIDKDPTLKDEEIVKEAMATHKSHHYKNRELKINNPLDYLPEEQLQLNVNSSSQMRGLWKYLGLESDVTTQAGEESFSKDVLKEIKNTTINDDVKDIINEVLKISETRNLIGQYIPKYIGSYKDGFSYGSIKFPGTKSFRVSSAMGKGNGEDDHRRGIPLVTLPGSTKKATEAKEGWILAASDYSNLTY